MKKVMLAKWLMNALPNTPTYQEKYFVSEIFRHPNYCSLDSDDQLSLCEKFVENNILEAKHKPFDLFYPSYSFRDMFEGKKLLDLGCSIGGKTFYLGEKWKVGEFCGIDVNQQSIDAANHFLTTYKTDVSYKFLQGYAENMPFENEIFDAVISNDVIEHVCSVKDTLLECKRVLKKNGTAFFVFPSFNMPLGGAHIASATKTPFLEWFFSPKTINEAFLNIVEKWGEELNWFKPTEKTKEDWAVVRGGIGVNGTKYRDFISTAKEVGFNEVIFINIPLLYVSNTAIKYPKIKYLCFCFMPLLAIDFLKDYLTHRLTFVLKK